MLKVNIHAGHNPANKIACGAVGILNESNEARVVKNEVIRQLTLLGHTAYDCTVDNGASQADVLSKIVAKCNSHDVDYDISIHFNSGRKDPNGDGKTGGVEVYIYDEKLRQTASKICGEIAHLGFNNRGVKISKDLYVLRKTKAPAMLIECCFVDDADDARIYNAYNIATAIVKGLTGQTYQEPATPTDVDATSAKAETKTGDKDALWRVQVGAFSSKANAERLMGTLKQNGFDAYLTH